MEGGRAHEEEPGLNLVKSGGDNLLSSYALENVFELIRGSLSMRDFMNTQLTAVWTRIEMSRDFFVKASLTFF